MASYNRIGLRELLPPPHSFKSFGTCPPVNGWSRQNNNTTIFGSERFAGCSRQCCNYVFLRNINNIVGNIFGTIIKLIRIKLAISRAKLHAIYSYLPTAR
ncbi:hypothetical protein C4K08_2095 [Pseudomonas chlororaphis subsp. aureofaciens]|nr:hypothetical protein C4K08_2095 [Pseudomonas chlororaphis subsp. aureofaciens]